MLELSFAKLHSIPKVLKHKHSLLLAEEKKWLWQVQNKKIRGWWTIYCAWKKHGKRERSNREPKHSETRLLSCLWSGNLTCQPVGGRLHTVYSAWIQKWWRQWIPGNQVLCKWHILLPVWRWLSLPSHSSLVLIIASLHGSVLQIAIWFTH